MSIIGVMLRASYSRGVIVIASRIPPRPLSAEAESRCLGVVVSIGSQPACRGFKCAGRRQESPDSVLEESEGAGSTNSVGK